MRRATSSSSRACDDSSPASRLTDLVAEPVAPIEPPQEVELGSHRILVDTPHEILVNKLCALLSRSELRDIVDVRDLLAHGGDLERAVADAPRKDSGFSPATLAWTLQRLPVADLAVTARTDDAATAELERFRDELVDRLTRIAKPDG